jgi:hypothetical protein
MRHRVTVPLRDTVSAARLAPAAAVGLAAACKYDAVPALLTAPRLTAFADRDPLADPMGVAGGELLMEQSAQGRSVTPRGP